MTANPDQSSEKILPEERRTGEQIRALSYKLRSNPKLVNGFFILWSVLAIVLPWASYTKFAVYKVADVSNSTGTQLLLILTMLAFVFLHELNSDWYKKFLSLKEKGLKFSAADLTSLGRSILSSQFMTRTLALVCGITFLGFLEEFAIDAFRAGGLLQSLALAFIGALLMPTATVAALAASRHTIRARARQGCLTGNVVPGKQNQSNRFSPIKAIDSFLSNRALYLSAYSSFALFIAAFSFGPSGLGSSFAGWLQASLYDANIGNGTAGPEWTLAVSAICAFALFSALGPLAVRLCASFQVLVNRILVHGDNLLEALMETANVKRTAIALPETHVHLRNIAAIGTWLVVCYASLFFLVAFCPPPLGDTVRGWLQGSLFDARFDFDISKHPNVRLFLASIVAGYGAAPVAAMTCSFLPRRKPRSMIVSSQGILRPASDSMFGLSPLKAWPDLQMVRLVGTGEKQTLKLCYCHLDSTSFTWLDSIGLKVSDMQPQELNELLAAADEYAVNCEFEPAVLALRAKLLEEAKSNSITEAGKFSSTIFSPRKNGDYLHGTYRVVRKLAGKALSAVYLARDPQDRHVVVKEFVLPSNAQQRERMLASFEREFQILSLLDHRGIACVEETFEENDARYIVIEYIQGTDLRTIVEKRGCRSESTVRRWAMSIAEIMQFLHSQDPPVLHRDLTPDNLMEDLDGNIKLIDFGAAHQFMEGVTGTLIGKQCYIAPEQLRGQPSIKSDIYSFGCTLYFLLTGEDPAALRQSDLPDDVVASPQMRELIRVCTHFDESQRYQSFREIYKTLEAFLDPAGKRSPGSQAAADPAASEFDSNTEASPASTIKLPRTEEIHLEVEP